MVVKLGFCVLVSLILLVTYGTEAREMAEQNSDFLFNYKDGAEDNRQQAPEQNSDLVFNYKEEVEDIHPQIAFNYKHEGEESKHMHSSSHLGIFFLMDDIKLGKTLTLSFPSSLQMLPKKVPFSLKELTNLVKRFSFSNDSPQVKSMEETLRVCEESPIKGETKYCATSIEAMRDFVQHVMGENTQIEPLITSTNPLNHNRLQNYTILNDPEDVGGTKMVTCHTMHSAYTVYYCHNTVSKSKVLKVSLRNDANGDKVEAIAACHLDTSDWSPSHVSFRVLDKEENEVRWSQSTGEIIVCGVDGGRKAGSEGGRLDLLMGGVTYGTEAREMAEGNSQSLIDYKQNSGLVFNYKDRAEDIHPQMLFKYKREGEEPKHMHSSSSHLGIFFLMDDLKLGKTLTISFPTTERKAADDYSIPFSLKELPNLLRRFSNDAKSMEQTLRVCKDSPAKGETKYCATSVEAMRDFVQHILGEKTQIEALTTMKSHSEEYSSTPLNHDHLQNYTILNDPEDVGATKMVACHTMTSAYTVYYCHYAIGKSKLFKVSLRNDVNGDKVEAIAVCHLDTSEWSPSHVSLRVLGILPGTSPVCHFFPSYSLVWVPKTIVTIPSEASL
ncbi:hypothetical protein H5410_020326 [Solanum commersonii]|uniref:BURP domain-containing protein n=1 Tax=Solanum commersonii TaxID=4109 RepID=A0A9J5Z9R2_SOLCO|nr:hypothetical protein H5410_020326 [Solanum commersonii]